MKKFRTVIALVLAIAVLGTLFCASCKREGEEENENDGAELLADVSKLKPEFSTPGGFYIGKMTVRISYPRAVKNAGYKIRITYDGSEPDVSSQQYGGGCPYPNTIAVGVEKIFMADTNGLSVYDGMSVTPYARKLIEPLWRNVNKDAMDQMCAVLVQNKYYLAVPENSGIDSSYVKEQDIFLTKNGLYEWQLSVIPEMSDISAYLWNFERIYYDNDTFTTTTPGIIGIHGESNFYIDIDNQQDYIAVNEYDEVIPSNVRYDESIVVYPKYDSNGNIVMPRDRDVIFEDNSTNIGTVVIKSNFTVYYGNTRAQIKGIGFQYSDSSVFRAMAYNIPATIYPIIIPGINL